MAASIVRIALALLVLAGGAAPALAQDDAERLRIHGSNSIGRTLVPALVEDRLDSMEYHQVRRVSRCSAAAGSARCGRSPPATTRRRADATNA